MTLYAIRFLSGGMPVHTVNKVGNVFPDGFNLTIQRFVGEDDYLLRKRNQRKGSPGEVKLRRYLDKVLGKESYRLVDIGRALDETAPVQKE